MKPREEKAPEPPDCCGQGWRTFFSRATSPVPAQLWFGGAERGTRTHPDSSGPVLCLAEQSSCRRRSKQSPKHSWKLGIAWRLPEQSSLPGKEGTLAFLVPQGHSQIHWGVARICLRRQVSAASCKQEVRAWHNLVPALGQSQGEEMPRNYTSRRGWAAQFVPPEGSRE